MAWWNPITWLQTEQRSLNNPTTSISSPAAWFIDFGGPPTGSGVAVNEETALAHFAVYACNRVLSESIASLPLVLYRRLPNGDVVPAITRPEHRLLAVTPSRFYTSYTYRSTKQLSVGLNGNGYSRIYRNGVGRPTELRILPASLTMPFLYEDRLYYRTVEMDSYGMPGRQIVLGADDVLHVKGLSSDGLIGKNPIQLMRETIGNGLAEAKTIGSMHKNGGRIPGVLKHPGKLTEEQVKDLRNAWKGQYAGVENAGSVPILQAGMEFQEIALSPADAQYIESHNVNAYDICGAYRVPPHMIGLLERSTNNNIEHQALEFVKFTMRPMAENYEAEYDRQLLPTEAQGEYFYQHEFDELLRGDMKSTAEYLYRLWGMGAINRDELRRKLNLNKVEGGEKFFIPVNMRDPLEPMPEAGAQGQGGQGGDNQNENKEPGAGSRTIGFFSENRAQ